MSLPLSKDIITAFSKYQKNAMTMKFGASKFSLTMTLGGTLGGKQEYGAIPDKLKTLREEAIYPKSNLSDRLQKVKEYISKLSAYFKVLKSGGSISWSWHSYISPKLKDKYIPNIDLEKAMVLLPIVFGLISEIESIGNHKEVILTGNSIQNHKLDDLIFRQIIFKYQTVIEILVYITSLNLNESNLPELSPSFLNGLLYYVRGFENIFSGLYTYYNENNNNNNNNNNVLLQSYLIDSISFDNGKLAKAYSTSATFFYKSSVEFKSLESKNVIDSKIMKDLISTIDFFHVYYEAWSYLLYGFPSLNLFVFNTSQPQIDERIPYYLSQLNTSPQCCSYLITYINKSFSYCDLLKKEKKYSSFKDIVEFFIHLTDSIRKTSGYMTLNSYYDSRTKCDELSEKSEINRKLEPLYISDVDIVNNEFTNPIINIKSKFVEKWKVRYTGVPADMYQNTMNTMFPDFC